MFSASSLLASVFLALSVAASPLLVRDDVNVSTPFALHLNLSGMKLADLDRARAAHIIQRGKQLDQTNPDDQNATLPLEQIHRRDNTVNITNTAISYLAAVEVGNPPTTYTLLIDTGSSNTWIGSKKAYSKTSTSKETGNKVSVNYGVGKMTGEEYTDTLSLSSSLVINNQSIGVSSNTSGFENVDGVLGLGPTNLTAGTVSNQTRVPTVVDNLLAQKKIDTEVVGISFNPAAKVPEKNGQISFGGVDSSKYMSTITYAQITNSTPARYYWGFDQSVSYGSSGESVLSSTAGILDTGTSLILLATDAFNRYKNLTGAVADSATGLLKLSNYQYQNLQSLFFTIGNDKFELVRNAQVWPRSLNTFIGGVEDSFYLIVADLGSDSGQGLDFICGYTFLERFYSVYDSAENRVGLANTAHTKESFA